MLLPASITINLLSSREICLTNDCGYLDQITLLSPIIHLRDLALKTVTSSELFNTAALVNSASRRTRSPPKARNVCLQGHNARKFEVLCSQTRYLLKHFIVGGTVPERYLLVIFRAATTTLTFMFADLSGLLLLQDEISF
jgi:hypothetical protein